MKFVGCVSNEEEIYELEHITKVFLLERRMKHLTSDLVPLPTIKKTERPHITYTTTIKNNTAIIAYCAVKGLN